MSGASVPEAVVGFLLLFFLPGYAVTRALFPEWHLRGSGRLRRLLETVTLSFVLSVVLVVLLGYLFLQVAPGGFQAYWTDPLLESGLAAVMAVGLAIAASRGAFSRKVPSLVPSTPLGEEGAWEVTRRLDRLTREERRVSRSLNEGPSSPEEQARLRSRLAEIRAEIEELGLRREAEIAE